MINARWHGANACPSCLMAAKRKLERAYHQDSLRPAVCEGVRILIGMRFVRMALAV